MSTLFQKVACKLLVVYIGRAVPVYVRARNVTYATPEQATVEKWATVETVVMQTGQGYAKHFHKFKIKIMSSFNSNEAWFQTNILYGILPLYIVMELNCISCICKYVTCINM